MEAFHFSVPPNRMKDKEKSESEQPEFHLISCELTNCLNKMVKLCKQKIGKEKDLKLFCSTNCFQKFIDDPTGKIKYFDMHSQMNETIANSFDCGNELGESSLKHVDTLGAPVPIPETEPVLNEPQSLSIVLRPPLIEPEPTLTTESQPMFTKPKPPLTQPEPLLTESESKDKEPRGVHSRYYLKDLKLVKVKDGQCVLISNYFSLNHVLVTPVHKYLYVDIMDLTDAITEQVEQDGDTFEGMELPEIGEIVLGKYWNGKAHKFYRGVVEQVLSETATTNTTKVLLRFLETGETAILGLSDLKFPNKEIMQHPIYGREVILDGISAENDFILWREFESFISSVPDNLFLQIISKEVNPSVKLFRHKSKTGKTINEEILELGKWNWEKKFEAGCRTDDEIIALKNENANLEIFQADLNFPKLQVNTEVELKVLLCSDHQNILCFPSDPKFKYNQELRVLEAQIARYCRMVKPGIAFYSKDSQIHLYKAGDQWVRVSRVWGKVLIGIDSGIPYKITPRKADMRPLPLDFARIPALGIQCILSDISRPLSEPEKTRIKEILAVQSVHKFKIRSLCEETGIYGLECAEVTAALSEGVDGKTVKNQGE